MNIADCTVPEKILLAAHQLEEEGQSPFSAEALIVTSWQKFPRTFGLKGYAEQYPDSNKVLSSIMGEKGLARRGWLLKMGQKLYSLSRDGRHVVKRISEGGDVPAASGAAVKLTRDQEKFLLALLNGAPLEKYIEGRKPELTFTDACRFWSINENTHGDALDSKLKRFRTNLAELQQVFSEGETELSNGRSISEEDLAQIVEAHEYLEERFSRHLSLLRTRAERT